MLDELIEKLKGLTGASREADVLIGYEFNIHADEGICSFRQFFDSCGMERTLRSAESYQSIWREMLPRYTASLEAGRTLLPKGTLWAVGHMEAGAFARLVIPQPDGGYIGGYVECCDAATAELCLCIAALMARKRLTPH